MLLPHNLFEVCVTCEKLVICHSKASLLAFLILKTKKHKTRKIFGDSHPIHLRVLSQ